MLLGSSLTIKPEGAIRRMKLFFILLALLFFIAQCALAVGGTGENANVPMEELGASGRHQQQQQDTMMIKKKKMIKKRKLKMNHRKLVDFVDYPGPQTHPVHPPHDPRDRHLVDTTDYYRYQPPVKDDHHSVDTDDIDYIGQKPKQPPNVHGGSSDHRSQPHDNRKDPLH